MPDSPPKPPGTAEPLQPLDPRALRGVVGLAVVLGALYVSAGMLDGQPLDWDDRVWLTDPLLQESFSDAVFSAFTTVRDRAYYPLLRLSWWLQGAVAPTPRAGHAIDLLAFLCCIPLAGAVLQRLGASRFVVFGSTALWALHPTRVESVAWLTSRKDVVSLMFLLLTVHLVLSERHRIALFAFAVACLFKAAVFPMAGGVVILQWVRGKREPVALGAGLVAVAAAVAVGGWVAYHSSETGLGAARANWPFDTAIENGAFLLGLQAHWVSSLLVPTGLAAVYPVPATPWLGGLAGAGLATAFGVAAWRGGRWGAVLLATWVLPLLPVHGLVAMAFWGADRHLLLPSFAAAVAVCLALERRAAFPTRAGIVGGLALFYTWGTVQRIPDWHDTLALWEADAQRSGTHWVRGLSHGTALGTVGRFDDAVVAFRSAEAVAPDPSAHGRVLARRIIAELAADGWTQQDAALAALLQPPPSDAAGWRAVSERLPAPHGCDAWAQSARLDASVAGSRPAGCVDAQGGG